MRTIIILNLCGYDLVKGQLKRMGVDVAETQHDAGIYKMFDTSNRIVADINYMHNKAKIYDWGSTITHKTTTEEEQKLKEERISKINF